MHACRGCGGLDPELDGLLADHGVHSDVGGGFWLEGLLLGLGPRHDRLALAVDCRAETSERLIDGAGQSGRRVHWFFLKYRNYSKSKTRYVV